MTLSVAGAELNVAIVLAHLGHPVRFFGRVGDDDFGRLILRTGRAETVDCSGVIVDPGAPTGMLMKFRRTADTTVVHYYRHGSAGSRLHPADVDESRSLGRRCFI